MADYHKAFQYAFSVESIEPSSTQAGLEKLAIWQTLSVNGFSEKEICALCEDLYVSELWHFLKGAQIYDQKVAGLLLLVASRGYLSELLSEIQHYVGIQQSSEMCDATLRYINKVSVSKLQQWLYASVAYFDLVKQKQTLIERKTATRYTVKGELIPNIGILSV
ncbi:hypothetical protein A7985_02985 [Pseudoalteromonas luteoviolacea]|uniref:Uncharacterized protein n=1 Tax=Pseudoalteromonas luteoviolacea TaxID=43657 RepID=A0A1C0TUE8_9GAMM|nr:hypothetical protein [Pseudoalteromonas luteoviolacea]MBQ4812925.1 hypothetical protein [Pseudoalteromonas luteoviolacea]OCQ22940.1 hypothetical protein A7985_02985 [Pseudoalteromonas luteoviolacea]